MINNLKNNKILWGVTTLLTFFAAIYGLIDNNIYSGLFPLKFIAAQFSQDWLTIAVCLFLGYLILSTKPDSIKRPVIIIGIMGSLAYLYGIFSIERVYNVLYLVYLAILGTSFFSVVFAISSLNRDVLKTLEVKKGVKYTDGGFFAFDRNLVFTPLDQRAAPPYGDQNANPEPVFDLPVGPGIRHAFLCDHGRDDLPEESSWVRFDTSNVHSGYFRNLPAWAWRTCQTHVRVGH